MKIEPTANATPQSTPPTGTSCEGEPNIERFVWNSLAPRLIDPSKVEIIQALVRDGGALTLIELARTTSLKVDLLRHQCEAMEEAGVIEVIDRAAQPPGDDHERSYFLPMPPQAHPSSPSPQEGGR
jgi:predicted transcriptional regulator